jgi:hypothetical protein
VEEHGNAAAASFMRNNMDDAIMRCMVDVIKVTNFYCTDHPTK